MPSKAASLLRNFRSIILFVTGISLKSSRRITSWADLPPELWLIIFEHVVGSQLSVLTMWNHIMFPDTLHSIRDPRNYPPTSQSAIATLRLVCRAFNSLFKPSPRLVVLAPDTSHPSDTPAKFNCQCGQRIVSFHQLVSDPLRSLHIVTLDIPGCESYCPSLPALLSILCDNSAALPNVKCLSLGLYSQGVKCKEPPVLRFWGDLNDAFPHLVCLVLRGKLKFFSPNPWGRVIFRHLEVLDADKVFVDSSVYFPVLRHAAFGLTSLISVAQFHSWSLLESLIIRGMYELPWHRVPCLRFLGLPSSNIRLVSVTPAQHPLRHVCFYMVPTRDQSEEWVRWRKQAAQSSTKGVLRRLPNLEQITLVYPPLLNSELVSIDVDEEEIIRSGFNREASSIGCRDGEHRVIFSSPKWVQ